MTMFAGMNEELDDEDVKKDLMRCFFNAPTSIQVIEKLRGMKQRPGENARDTSPRLTLHLWKLVTKTLQCYVFAILNGLT